jgi:signal transduction histidine kinase
MTTRIFLILFMGIFICSVLVLVISGHDKKENELRIHTRHMGERIDQVLHVLSVSPKSARPLIGEIYQDYGIKINFTPRINKQVAIPPTEFTKKLMTFFPKDSHLTIIEVGREECFPLKPRYGLKKEESRCIVVNTQLKDGGYVELDILHNNNQPSPVREEFAINVLFFVLGIALVSLWVAFIASRPLRELAQAANNLSSNIDQAPIPEEGPKEVIEASKAFNNMQRSIKNHLKERTFMLAAIAHDLQTPLTKMRLRVEKIENPELYQNFVSDIAQMQQLIREGLDFANSLSDIKLNERVDIHSLLETVCQDALESGHQATFEGGVSSLIQGSSSALKRAFSNLVDNAIKYGQKAAVKVIDLNDRIHITVTDAGLGISEDMWESVFEPFKRIEDSRSRLSGGTGLGLTVAKTIIEKHGGKIWLENLPLPQTGLIVNVELPVIKK